MDDWVPQTTSSPAAGWTPWTPPPQTQGSSLQLDWPLGAADRRFFRLHRTW